MVRRNKDTDASKRKRAPNFTEQETIILTKLTLGYLDIIEEKKNDSVSWKAKQSAWLKISAEFNTLGHTVRTADCLRLKYDGIKKEIKKKINTNRDESFKTGVGPTEYKPINMYEGELLKYMLQNVNGIPSQDDSDASLPETNNIFDERMSLVPIQQATEMEEMVERTLENEYTIKEEPDNLEEETEDVLLEGVPTSSASNYSTNETTNEDSLEIKKHHLELEVLQIQKTNSINNEKRQKIEHNKRVKLLNLDIEAKELEILLTKKRLQQF